MSNNVHEITLFKKDGLWYYRTPWHRTDDKGFDRQTDAQMAAENNVRENATASDMTYYYRWPV